MEVEIKERKGFGVAGLVVGIIGIALSFIPIINNISFVLGLLAVIFGVITISKKTSKGKAIAAIILGILAVVITLSVQSAAAKALDDISNELDEALGENTEAVLDKYLDVEFGEFVVEGSDFPDGKLTLTVTNKSDEAKSFSITIEAIDKDGVRIDTDTVYVDTLNAKQSQKLDAFTLVSSDDYSALKEADFKVVEASVY